MKPKDSAPHFILSSSPHTHCHASVSRIMLDVIIALLPTTIVGIYFFGLPALWTVLTCVSTCLVTEAVCRILMKREHHRRFISYSYRSIACVKSSGRLAALDGRARFGVRHIYL